MKGSAGLIINLRLIQTRKQLEFNKEVTYFPSTMN
jgi:hypothetical protein